MSPETHEAAPSLQAAQLLRLMFATLAERVVRVLTLLMAFGLFLGAVWYPDWRRLAAAASFAVIVLPMVWLRKEPRNG